MGSAVSWASLAACVVGLNACSGDDVAPAESGGSPNTATVGTSELDAGTALDAGMQSVPPKNPKPPKNPNPPSTGGSDNAGGADTGGTDAGGADSGGADNSNPGNANAGTGGQGGTAGSGNMGNVPGSGLGGSDAEGGGAGGASGGSAGEEPAPEGGSGPGNGDNSGGTVGSGTGGTPDSGGTSSTGGDDSGPSGGSDSSGSGGGPEASGGVSNEGGAPTDSGGSTGTSGSGAGGEPQASGGTSAEGGSSAEGGTGASGPGGDTGSGGVPEASGGDSGEAGAAGSDPGGMAGAAGSGGDPGTSGGSSGEGGMPGSGGTSGSGGSLSGGSGGAEASGGAGGGGGDPEPGDEQLYAFANSIEGDLYAFQVGPSGELDLVASYSNGALNPLRFITASTDGHTLYGGSHFEAWQFGFDPNTLEFSIQDQINTAGPGTEVELDRTGQYLFIPHLFEPVSASDPSPFGKFTFVPVSASGFGTPQVFEDAQSPGRRPHHAGVHPNNSWVYVPCVESEHIVQYVFDADLGTLVPGPTFSVPGGPRHMDFHPNGEIAYVLTENTSLVYTFEIDQNDGALVEPPLQVISTNAAGNSLFSADIHVSPDGGLVYATNRFVREIVGFQVQEDYTLERASTAPLATGDARLFAFHPDGQHVYVTTTDGNLQTFEVDPDTSDLTLLPDAFSGLGDLRTIKLVYVTL